MHIHFIPEVIRSDALPIPDDTCHNTKDHIICYRRIYESVMVTSNNVSIRKNFYYSVEDILFATFVQNNIIFLITFRTILSYLDYVFLLPKEWQHAIPQIVINQISILLQEFFKRNKSDRRPK